MPTAVVTGANSGIGHAFAQVLIKQGYDVTATDVQLGRKIRSLGCPTAELDVSSQASIDAFASSYSPPSLDLLLNIAGIMSGHEADSLARVNSQTLERLFAINTFGPLLLTQALLPKLLAAPHPKVGFMSSRVGSIADNSTGGMYAYRSSKAALNSICKSLAMDLKDKGVVVVIMHPGYVKTGLDPSTHGLAEAVEPDEAATKLWGVLRSKEIADTGKFWHREGQEIPW
ncbi:NAD(P)-binding protein [Saccharata proteae CBS 121410]|uniref:NAD(P)-binding protein n=1 Tax=Saccharata proteae CBS 121410 TaxID=1314787 RepID=A0A9P4LYN2_9PEZI|nr:NAD(P)-binding protein [Saccharata proteae CBS 121410]